jgi:hypothetical protein
VRATVRVHLTQMTCTQVAFNFHVHFWKFHIFCATSKPRKVEVILCHLSAICLPSVCQSVGNKRARKKVQKGSPHIRRYQPVRGV